MGMSVAGTGKPRRAKGNQGDRGGDPPFIEIGRRIARAREAVDLNRSEVGRRLGVSPQAMSEYERGLYLPKSEHLVPLSRILATTTDYILAGSGAPPILDGAIGGSDRGRIVPLITWPDLANYVPTETIASRHLVVTRFPCGPRSFQTLIHDRSTEARFQSGDAVTFDPDLNAQPEHMVLVVHAGIAMMREYRARGSKAELAPLNNRYETITATLGRTTRILGVLIEHTRHVD